MADDVTSTPPPPDVAADKSSTPTPTPPSSTPQPPADSTPAAKETKSAEKENATPKSDSNASEGKVSFKEQFKAFSKFGDTKSDGKLITLSQSDKWMKQAKVIDGKKVTTTDTGIHFKKFKSLKISLEDYKKYLDTLAKAKGMTGEDLQDKLSSCGSPGLHSSGPSKADATVERLTDVSKYTGSHKQRFDQTGKGKGIAGRKDIPDSSGYVQGYQNKNTYSKSH